MKYKLREKNKMSKPKEIKTFNEKDLKSIFNLANEVADYAGVHFDDEFLLFNIKKALDELNLLDERNYSDDTTQMLLLGLVLNLLYLARTEKLIKSILNCEFHQIYSK